MDYSVTFWSCFGFLQTTILHELESKRHVMHLLERKTSIFIFLIVCFVAPDTRSIQITSGFNAMT